MIELNKRQENILEIVKNEGPITGDNIAERLKLSRAALRADLAILTMSGLLDARPRVGYFYLGREVYSKRLRDMKVKDYKAIPVVVNEKSTAYDAMCMMFMENVGSVLVVKEEAEKNILIGIVSKKDLLKVATGPKNTVDIPISMVMTRSPHIITTTLNDSIYDSAKKIIEYEINCLPVVNRIDEKNELIGVITRETITKVFVELGSVYSV